MTKLQGAPWAVEPTEKGLRSLEQLRDFLGVQELPAGLSLLAQSEAGISDLLTNLRRHLAPGEAPFRSKWLVAVAAAATTGSPEALRLFSAAAQAAGIPQTHALDAVAVALTCSTFNGYHRFRHQVPEADRAPFEGARVPFHANALVRGALAPAEVEGLCVIVSSLNDCHACVEAHLHKALQLGLTHAQVDELLRVAAVVAALGRVLASLAPTAFPADPSPKSSQDLPQP